MFFQKIIGTSDNDTLFCPIIIFVFPDSKQGNIKANSPQGSMRKERMVSKTISFPPRGFQTAVAVSAKTGKVYP